MFKELKCLANTYIFRLVASAVNNDLPNHNRFSCKSKVIDVNRIQATESTDCTDSIFLRHSAADIDVPNNNRFQANKSTWLASERKEQYLLRDDFHSCFTLFNPLLDCIILLRNIFILFSVQKLCLLFLSGLKIKFCKHSFCSYKC
jgi:hypothetical protein